MKHLKTYENINKIPTPQIGDYVVCNDKLTTSDEANNILKNTIGKIIKIVHIKYNIIPCYVVHYAKIPKNVMGHFSYGYIEKNVRKITLVDIRLYSSNKEELKTKIEAEKYNL